jgi:FAD synthetase
MKKVLAGGCFNLIHPGHKYFLKKAKKLGNFLVVVLTNDANNRKPYAVPAEQRKTALERLAIADKVLVGETDDFTAVLRKFRPDIIALGHDQELIEATKKEAEKMKIRVVRIGKFGDYSTGKIIGVKKQ